MLKRVHVDADMEIADLTQTVGIFLIPCAKTILRNFNVEMPA